MARRLGTGLGAYIAATLVVSALAGYIISGVTYERLIYETARRGDNVLQLATASLTGQLDRFERLPALIADQPIVRAALSAPHDAGQISQANRYLDLITRQLGATDVYLMDQNGLTLAASNYAMDTTFVGRNFAFRPYFTDAMRGGTGRYFALGTTSQKRGYYFGAPVLQGGAARGVLVFKIDLDAIEQDWRGGDYAVIVTDAEGVIFLSSRQDWLFRATQAMTRQALQQLTEERRYSNTRVELLNISADTVGDGFQIWTIADQQFVLRSTLMPQAEWKVNVLVTTDAAKRDAAVATVLAMASVGLLGMLGLVAWQQRARLAERLALQAEARADLERRVEMRTNELKQAQSDLVQAGKLAALGQMSAALSHEFNQPLAAARTFAENAAVFLQRDRPKDALGNIDRILGLIDRLASISRHLSSFARKPGQALKPVDIAEVIDASLEIAALRLKASGAKLALQIAPNLPAVIAGPVRLQQVLVNILTNAADATEERADGQIVLAAYVDGDHVVIDVADNGPGVSEALQNRIFDPFFSTKLGKGLGLGLSISYNIIKDFGGSLQVGWADLGGALFTIRLRVAKTAETADHTAQQSPAP